MTNRAIFLDRDGVINHRSPWVLYDPERLRLIDGAIETIAKLSNAGYRTIITTNQPWLEVGTLDPGKLTAFHEHIRKLVEAQGGRLDAAYACPHRAKTGCTCRKPGVGMLEEAQRVFELDPASCWMIGDKPSDIHAGAAFGARTVWVTSERFPWERLQTPPEPDHEVDTLEQAGNIILDGLGPEVRASP